MDGSTFRLLSLNTWGYHTQAEKIKERFKFIAETIKKKDYDVVALQEVWHKGDYQQLVNALEPVYPHNYYFFNGNAGSGICLFSKFPIVDAQALPFHIVQGVFAVLRLKLELLTGKGCLSCRLKTPLGYVKIYILHTDTDYTHRLGQLYEAIQFVASTSGGDPVIFCGDFNMDDVEHPYGVITDVLGMKDAFEKNKEKTCQRPDNVWTHSWINRGYLPSRLDYVFYSDNGCSDVTLQQVESKLALEGFVPGGNYNFSDHSGVEVQFCLEKRPESSSPGPSLGSRFSGDSLDTKTRQFFHDTLCVMSEHFKAYKDPSIFRVFTRSTGHGYLVLLLLVLVSIVTLSLSPFLHPFVSIFGFGMGIAITLIIMGILSDTRHQYAFESLQRQLAAKVCGLSLSQPLKSGEQ